MMQPEIWEDEDHRIHLIHNGDRVSFPDLFAFQDVIAACQEFIVMQMDRYDLKTETIWAAFAQANRN